MFGLLEWYSKVRKNPNPVREAAIASAIASESFESIKRTNGQRAFIAVAKFT